MPAKKANKYDMGKKGDQYTRNVDMQQHIKKDDQKADQKGAGNGKKKITEETEKGNSALKDRLNKI